MMMQHFHRCFKKEHNATSDGGDNVDIAANNVKKAKDVDKTLMRKEEA